MASATTQPEPLRFDITVATVKAWEDEWTKLLQDFTSTIISKVAIQDATFSNVVLPIIHLQNELDQPLQMLSLLQNVSPDPALRGACSQAVQKMTQAQEELLQDEELFKFVDAVHQRCQDGDLEAESRRHLDDICRWFRNNGINLSSENRVRYQIIAARLIRLRNEFMDNIATTPGTLSMTQEELRGLSKRKLEDLDKDDDGKYKISLKGPEYNAVMEHCEIANTRKELYIKSQGIYPANVSIFREIMLLRDEAARLLGYSSYSAQQIETNMTNTPSAVYALLQSIQEKCANLVLKEKEALQHKFKSDGSPLCVWDFNYYNQKLEAEGNVDHDLISEYFPADYTIPQIMMVFQDLFGIVIEEIHERDESHVWHPDVKMFAVWDGKRALTSFLGYLYTDIYPRDGKYSHAANFNIGASYIQRDGTRKPVSTSLICNVTKPSSDRPSLLQHSEVVVVLHELGHGIHDLLGKTKYAAYSGHRTTRDFVEAPSQFLEYWCWTPAVLKRMSCHYSYLSENYNRSWCQSQEGSDSGGPRPPKVIPDQLVNDLLASKNINRGIAMSRQVALSLFDMAVHDPASHEALEATDIGQVSSSLTTKHMQFVGPTDREAMGNGHVATSHFIWGVQANYYGYLQTRLFAADIWDTCFRNDPMNPAAAKRYRKIILDKGGNQDMKEAMRELLGRDPCPDAYFKEIGIA